MIAPLFECKTDQEIMYLFAKKFGFDNELCKNIKVVQQRAGDRGHPARDQPLVLDHRLHRLSPERLKLQMENKHTFNPSTLRAEAGPCKGDYYGLPWPCWGRPS